MAGQNVIVAASISPQVLVSQQLTTSEVAVYTCAASTSVKVAQASVGTCSRAGSAGRAPVLSIAALMNPVNSGWGRSGLLLNSGWNWLATNQG